jgi:hypothetical protein
MPQKWPVVDVPHGSRAMRRTSQVFDRWWSTRGWSTSGDGSTIRVCLVASSFSTIRARPRLTMTRTVPLMQHASHLGSHSPRCVHTFGYRRFHFQKFSWAGVTSSPWAEQECRWRQGTGKDASASPAIASRVAGGRTVPLPSQQQNRKNAAGALLAPGRPGARHLNACLQHLTIRVAVSLKWAILEAREQLPP